MCKLHSQFEYECDWVVSPPAFPARTRRWQAVPVDKLLLTNLVFFGRHGCLAAERELGQKFRVTAELSLDLREAGATDDLTQTVDWWRAYHEIKALVEGKPYNLLEALAEEIARTLLAHGCVQEAKVRVEKIEPALPGPGTLGVEIVRKRNA